MSGRLHSANRHVGRTRDDREVYRPDWKERHDARLRHAWAHRDRVRLLCEGYGWTYAVSGDRREHTAWDAEGGIAFRWLPHDGRCGVWHRKQRGLRWYKVYGVDQVVRLLTAGDGRAAMSVGERKASRRARKKKKKREGRP